MTISRKQTEDLNRGEIGIIGYPWDSNSSYLRGTASAPEAIIESIENPSANFFTERLTDLAGHEKVSWLGNAMLRDYFDITKASESILKHAAIPFGFGGDHSVTFPIIQSIFRAHGPVTIIHFDAHNDLYHDFEGNPYSHASPFARIMENNLASRLIQIGTRTTSRHQMDQVERFGVELFPMHLLHLINLSELKSPIYISFDMDVLDPAFAPGVSHHEPGGLSTREALNLLHQIKAPIVGMDLVEYNPDRDINEMTGMLAAKIAKEMIDLALHNNRL